MLIKEFIEKAISRGDRAVNELTNELLLHESFSAAVEKALMTKGMLDRKIRVVLNSMNVATKVDLDEIHDELRRIRREIRTLKRRIDSSAPPEQADEPAPSSSDQQPPEQD